MKNALRLVGVLEIRKRNDRLVAGEDSKDVGTHAGEAMLVADEMRGGPVILDVRMSVCIGAHDPTPATQSRVDRVIPPLECVHSLEIKAQGSLFTVDFKAIRILVSGSEASGFETGDGPLLHPAHEHQTIIHGGTTHLSAAGGSLSGDRSARPLDQPTLLDEGLLDRTTHFRQFVTGDESSHVDDVRVEIAMCARTRVLADETP